jgi:hypothetical protein
MGVSPVEAESRCRIGPEDVPTNNDGTVWTPKDDFFSKTCHTDRGNISLYRKLIDTYKCEKKIKKFDKKIDQ